MNLNFAFACIFLFSELEKIYSHYETNVICFILFATEGIRKSSKEVHIYHLLLLHIEQICTAEFDLILPFETLLLQILNKGF